MIENPYNFPISSCPCCGSKTIAIKQYIHGYGEYCINLETGKTDTSQLHFGLQYRNARKYAVCRLW